MEHWSERFDRPFKDDDWLDRHEAAAVLSQNSGRAILPEYLAVQVQRGALHPELRRGKRYYRYAELAHLHVAPQGGRRQSDNPSPSALRKRAYDARQRLKMSDDVRATLY